MVESVTKKPLKRSPAPPFTTSTLQQEAARKLGFTVVQTMMIAQKLYESGRITYMRTDSVNLLRSVPTPAKMRLSENMARNTARLVPTTPVQRVHRKRTRLSVLHMNEPTIEGTAQREAPLRTHLEAYHRISDG